MLNRSSVSAAQLLKWGNIFEEEELINDAIDFYEKAADSESLEKLLPLVHDQGDTFIYGRILKALGRQVPADEWISLGKRAAELGKDAFALGAYRRGGVETPLEVETMEEPAS
jgi:hypothetical protein